jgi:hypothetical protein
MSRRFTQNQPKPAQTIEQHADLRERSQQGATAAHLMDFTQTVVLPDQEKSIRKRIFALIDDPDIALDPDIAAQAWIELRAAYKLVERLRKIKTGGQVANLALADSPLNPES